MKLRRAPSRALSGALSGALLWGSLAAGCGGRPVERTAPAPQCGDEIPPEAATGRRDVALATSARFMAGAANPYAAAAGHDVLAEGGSAVDAAVAMAMMLTLVEPQSSGLGGGAFLLRYDAAERKVEAYDGRETAPATARPDMFADLIGPSGARDFKAHMSAVVSGKSVGVPGLLKMLALAHEQHGKLPWARLLAPAIARAKAGFVVSPRLTGLLDDEARLPADLQLCNQPRAGEYFCPDGAPLQPGAVRKNPALAALLEAIAERGPEALYSGQVARDIVAAVNGAPRMPGQISVKDLEGYAAEVRAPICKILGAAERLHTVCGMPPPTSGGIAVIQIMGVLRQLIDGEPLEDGLAAHLLAEAGRVAYADRDRYVADPKAMTIDPEQLITDEYLRRRAQAIRGDDTTGPVAPIDLGAHLGDDASPELPSTSHMVAADAEGNVISMTASIEYAFGSRIFVHGFLLNNELTDFSFLPKDAEGRPVANRVEAGKRPRSSMAPMIVLDGDGRFVLAAGSPGGSRIIGYVAQTLFEVLYRGKDVQAAINTPHVVNRNDVCTEVEAPSEGQADQVKALVEALKARGHGVKVRDLNSGLHALRRVEGGYQGGADPRREGMLYGDGHPPPADPADDLPKTTQP